MQKKFVYFICASGLAPALMGVGCISYGPPPDTSYLQTAKEFSQPSGPVTGGQRNFVPAPLAPNESGAAAAGISIGTEQNGSIGASGGAPRPSGPSVYIKPTSTTGAELTYLQALTIYQQSGFYIQISSCRGLPGQLALKRSSRFMIDNRDRVPRLIEFGSHSYTVPALGFVVTAAPDTPGTYYLTCNGGGSANLIVQY